MHNNTLRMWQQLWKECFSLKQAECLWELRTNVATLQQCLWKRSRHVLLSTPPHYKSDEIREKMIPNAMIAPETTMSWWESQSWHVFERTWNCSFNYTKVRKTGNDYKNTTLRTIQKEESVHFEWTSKWARDASTKEKTLASAISEPRMASFSRLLSLIWAHGYTAR